MDVLAIVKEHPIPVVIGVMIVILIVSRSGSSVPASTGSNAALAVRSQELAVQSNSQIAGINSQTAIGLGAQATERYKAGESAAVARTNIAASLVNTSIGALSQQVLGDQANNLKVIQATFARAINNDNLSADAAYKDKVINAGIRMHVDDLNAQTNLQNNDNNFKLAQIGASGDIQKTLLGMNLEFAGKNLPTVLQHSENMARISGANTISLAQATGLTATELARINTRPAVIQADSAAANSQAQSDQGWLKTGAAIIASIFG